SERPFLRRQRATNRSRLAATALRAGFSASSLNLPIGVRTEETNAQVIGGLYHHCGRRRLSWLGSRLRHVGLHSVAHEPTRGHALGAPSARGAAPNRGQDRSATHGHGTGRVARLTLSSADTV